MADRIFVADSAEQPPTPQAPTTPSREAELIADAARLRVELDAARGALAAAEARIAQIPQLVADGVAESLALREAVRAVTPDYVFDGKTSEQIKADLRTAKLAKAREIKASIADSVSDAWLDGFLDAVVVAPKSESQHDYNQSKTEVADADDFVGQIMRISEQAYKEGRP